jgi:hypothetical protein
MVRFLLGAMCLAVTAQNRTMPVAFVKKMGLLRNGW